MARIREKPLCTSAVLPCARARPAFVGPGCGATLPVQLPPAPRGGVEVGGRLVVWVNKRLCDSPLSTQSGDQGPCPEERRCASKSRRRARPARAGGVCSAPKHNGCYNPRARTRRQVRGASRRPAGAVVLPQCPSVPPGKSSPNTCKRVKKKPRAREGARAGVCLSAASFGGRCCAGRRAPLVAARSVGREIRPLTQGRASLVLVSLRVPIRGVFFSLFSS